MYSRPSTSTSREPAPRSTKNGSPPTARNARTGEFTPPGINCFARAYRRALSVPTSTSDTADHFSDQVVFFRIRDPGAHEPAGLEPRAAVQMDHAVHVVRLPRRPADRHAVLVRPLVHEGLYLPADPGLVLLERDRPLDVEEALHPLAADLRGHLVRHRRRRRPLLDRVLERAHPVEAHLLEQLQERL